MCYVRNKKNTEFAKEVGKYYRQAAYQKKISGEYHLSEISAGLIPEGLDEDKIIGDFLEAVENLKEYPDNKAELYYQLVQERCISSDVTIAELSKKYIISSSMVYRRLQEAFEIIGEYMAQKGSTGGIK